MRMYNEVILEDKPETLITIDYIPEYDIEDYNLTNPKILPKFLDKVKDICRKSRCYKKLIQFLKDQADMNKCSFYKNINGINTDEIKIHMHHEPLTLFDIVNIIYNKRNQNHESLSEFQIAKEVMYNHYKMMVGLIPLSETVHEMVHNGFLFIPINVVFGYYKNFIDVYKEYIDPGILSILKYNEKVTEAYNFEKETKILTMDLVYIDISGAYELPKVEDIMKLFKEKLNEIQNPKEDNNDFYRE